MPLSLDGTGSITGISTVSVSDDLSHVGDANTKISFPANDTVSIDTSGSERVRISSNGLVNIGAGSSASGLSPLLHLHKNASSTAYLHITNNNTGITNNDGFLLGINGVGDCLVFNKDSTPIRFATQGLERLRIDSSGRLLVGDSNAAGAALVQVQKTSGDMLLVRNHATNYESLILSVASGTADIYASSGGSTSRPALRFITNDAERLRITSNGRINIGDTDQTQNVDQLSVTVAAQNALDNLARFQSNAAASGTSETLVKIYKGAGYGGVVSGYITQGSDHGLKLYTANNGTLSEGLRATSNGIIDAPSQAGFYARMQNNKNNVMGGGASYYTVVFDTDSGSICYDQHNTYSTSTGLYTVPTHGTGHYIVSTAVCLSTDAYGRAGEAWFIVGSNRYFFDRKYFTSTSGTITGYYGTCHIKLTAGQTIGVQGFVSGGSTDVDVLGANATDQITWFTARKIA